jgi:hypothetical protein
MKPTKTLQDLGQSLWLDNITRELLNSGTLQRYIDELSVTGLTSNPTIFDHAIKNSTIYDADILREAASAKSGEDVFFELALADLVRAAQSFQPLPDEALRPLVLALLQGTAGAPVASALHFRPQRKNSTSRRSPGEMRATRCLSWPLVKTQKVKMAVSLRLSRITKLKQRRPPKFSRNSRQSMPPFRA